jgi:hypothetical protein
MRLNVQIRDPFGVIVWQAAGELAPGYGGQLPAEDRAELLGAIAGDYVLAQQDRVGCEIVVTAC